MTSVHIFKPPNRLAKVIAPYDGAKAELLVENARSRVAELDSQIRGYVAKMLAKIADYATADDPKLFAARPALAAAALNIADVAGAIGMEAIGDIARGIDAMIESSANGEVWHPDALRLHIHSLGLISQTPGDRTEETVVVENLRALRRAIGIIE